MQFFCYLDENIILKISYFISRKFYVLKLQALLLSSITLTTNLTFAIINHDDDNDDDDDDDDDDSDEIFLWYG